MRNPSCPPSGRHTGPRASRRISRSVRGLPLVIATLLLGGPLAARAGGAVIVSARPAPAVPATAVTPMALSAAGEGRRVYLKLNCYSCHGMRAAGGMGPNIVHAEIGDVREKVLQGADEGMPSYRNYVTDADLSNLAAYLASVNTAAEPRFMDWWVANPTK